MILQNGRSIANSLMNMHFHLVQKISQLNLQHHHQVYFIKLQMFSLNSKVALTLNYLYHFIFSNA